MNETVHLVYRDTRGRITRYESYQPPARYGVRAYVVDAVLLAVLTLSLASAILAYSILVGG